MKEIIISDYNLRYRGEGNANIVISLEQVHEVLRITKWDPSVSESVQINSVEERLKASQTYVNTLLKPLLGDQYVHAGEIVKLSKADIECINLSTHHVRPEWRLTKGLPSCDWTAVLLPDLSYLSPSRQVAGQGVTLGLEIKPKCGFLPRSECVPLHYRRKCIVCKFHMNQVSKLQQKKIDSISRYCPLDLFSGCPKRMSHALDCLFENPQNNLRLFQDGKEVDLQTTSDVQACLALFFGGSKDLSELRRYFNKLVIETLTNRPLEDQKEYGDCRLPEDSVLGKILKGQQLDSLDVEGLVEHYEKLKQSFSSERLDELLYNSEEPGQEYAQNVKDSLLKVKEFLIAATCKDCSVLLVFRASDGSNLVAGSFATDPEERTYLTRASIVDLDTKPHSRIPKYLQTERELLKISENLPITCSAKT